MASKTASETAPQKHPLKHPLKMPLSGQKRERFFKYPQKYFFLGIYGGVFENHQWGFHQALQKKHF